MPFGTTIVASKQVKQDNYTLAVIHYVAVHSCCGSDNQGADRLLQLSAASTDCLYQYQHCNQRFFGTPHGNCSRACPKLPGSAFLLNNADVKILQQRAWPRLWFLQQFRDPGCHKVPKLKSGVRMSMEFSSSGLSIDLAIP